MKNEAQALTIAVLVDRASGNEAVGEMWTEVQTYPATATLGEVIANLPANIISRGFPPILGNVRLQVVDDGRFSDRLKAKEGDA